MKNVLIINGHQRYDYAAEGNLTKIYINAASEFFEKNDFNIKHSVVENDYNIKEEVKKLVWADYILFQYPIFWMGVPWVTKKYIDEIFSAGVKNGIYTDDGRSRSDTTKRYGSGGLMHCKKYMLSLTYNCPKSEFSDKDGFFDGLSLDEANVATHKVFQFCGAEPLETYAVHDVFKSDLDIDSELEKFTKVLEKNFI